MLRTVGFAVAMLLVMAFLLGGCGTPVAPGETPAPAGTEAPPPTQPAVTIETPSGPKVFTYIFWEAFFDLDPAHAATCENVVLNNCYENLVYYNPPGSEEALGPGLATSWEKSEDGTVWTFHLREGVQFQDGTTFNADAVKATIEYYKSFGGEGCTWYWDAVEDVQVIDDYTVEIHTSYAAPIDLISTAGYCGGMVSPAVVDQPKEWFDEGHCVGTGPYTIESFERGQRLVMTRFEDYWGGWQDNQFDKIVFEIVEDDATRLQMMEQGEADFIWDVAPDKAEELEATGNLQVYSTPSWKNIAMMLNTRKPPLDNVLVRQALAYSFPYDQIVERSEGFYSQSRGLIPQGLWGHCEDCFQYQYDLDKARDLLSQAGYPDGGFELTLTYMPAIPIEAWAVELWTFPLADLGITLKPESMTFEAMWELVKSDPATAQDIVALVWWPSWPTPYDQLKANYHCEDEIYWNWSYWCNSEFDELIDRGNELSASDLPAAEQLFIDAQAIAVEESPGVWFADFPDIVGLSSDVQGYIDNPAYVGTVFFHDVTTSR